MKRLATGLAIVLALVLMLAAIATAAPPAGICDKNPDHPSCPTTTTTTTTTTVPTEPPDLQPCASVTTIEGVVGLIDFACDWTPMEDSSTIGTVSVEVVSGQIGGLAIFVLDSLPGNICVLEQIDKPTEHESASFPLVDDRGTYWDTGGTNWCAPYDEFGPKEDLNGPPLHVRVNYRAKKDTVVEISLTPEQVVVSE